MAGLITFINPATIFDEKNETDADSLEKNFLQPPQSAQPQVMWFWMNGHISREGITLDLEAMKRAGIGGVLNFDAGVSIPKGPVEYGSNEWKKLKKHAISEAQRLGLEFTIHNCPGWSSSGGPWIPPELSMQQYTWSELYVAGGKKIDVSFPKPYHKLGYYKDVALLAFPSTANETDLDHYKVTSADGVVSKQKITGEDVSGAIIDPADKNEGWLLFDFLAKREIHSLTFLISSQFDPGDSFSEVRTAIDFQSSQD